MTPTSYDQASLTYVLTREQAHFWIGFLRGFITTVWSFSELILLPVLLFALSRRLNIQGIAFFTLAFFCIVTIPGALASYLIIRAYLQSFLPRIVSLDLVSRTLSLKCPRQSDTWPLVDCHWARGFSLQDTVGELLQNQPATLIQLPHDEPQLPRQVIAIPDAVDAEAWPEALDSNKIPLFNPESVTRNLKTPGTGVRIMGRGITLGVLIAGGLSALCNWMAGKPFWVPSVYLLSIIAGIGSCNYYYMLGVDDAEEKVPIWLMFLGCSVLFLAIGSVIAMHERLIFVATILAIGIHVVAGLALTWILFLTALQLSKLLRRE